MPIALVSPEPIRRRPGRWSELLEAADFEVVYPEGDATVDAAQLRRLLPLADVIMAGGETYSAELIGIARRAKIIARTGVGYDAVDLAAATSHGIPVTITPGTNHESVAEQALALLLAVMRRIALNDRIIRAGGWDRTLPKPLRGKTIGLVGFGRIGRAMVPRAVAFGLHVLAHDPAIPPDRRDDSSVEFVELDELLARADIVSLHLPVLDSTRKSFHRGTFEKMKPGAVLINTSRGGLVVESDLIDALESGRLSGAGLDVFDPEPPSPGNPLLQLPTVVGSPHVAGIDERSMLDMAELAARCMIEAFRGAPPRDCVVNPEVFDRPR
ncbi:MAG: phosphoglycerate dehydrogenase [Isosphaeraceae bacterium]|nr:phosphoglycerate dehydrogenase [Isosphaeraceae bacterium]